MHKLSDFSDVAGLTVLRDGSFSNTGKLSTELPAMCVPLNVGEFAHAANSNEDIASVITKPDLAELVGEHLALGVCSDPSAAHAEIHHRLAKIKDRELQSDPNRIDPSAKIDGGSWIADYGVQIGPNVHVMANARVYPGSSIGARTVLHSGVVIGAPGFNTAIIGQRQRILPSVGGVIVAEGVEMLPNSSVARALFGGHTIVGAEVCADSLVYIAHDVTIGRRVQICAQANILGRSRIGDGAYIGPAAVVKNGLSVGAYARVNIGSVVTQDVPPGATVSGNFAIPHDRFLRHIRQIR